ncbi:CheR family methyltransferase [Noviherbaspirillum denitrificans]|uniref:Chemotaxis protein methyltransferase n=1 Tax=Noviherbaspirillum denitrificans TaxID=1968433 RepID=A0A254TKS2_9BURK|nr:protein-glutamate O-methyltransferase CheR [Noviherbaspirillum denitrificans]OWW21912.1 SAM-dependent methyltransferase [Noviherbaspirillum denitrificans]
MKEITDQEFRHFQGFIFDSAGITLPPSKKTLVSGRLAKRLLHCHLDSYGDYFSLLSSGRAPDEVQVAIDLLTTNETYFFREPQHFDQLRQLALQARGRSEAFRVWSAASSTGEEAYSIAMVLSDCLGTAAWEVVGTDISSRVLQSAMAGHYTLERGRNIPPAFLRRFCLRGTGAQEGTLLVDKALRSRVQFRHANLNTTLPELGRFDVVFLRNVMIYFSDDTKRQVVARVLAQLRRGGHFYIGHSESLNGISDEVTLLSPSIYRKP